MLCESRDQCVSVIDIYSVSIGDVVLVRSGTRGEWCLGVLYDWVIAQSEEEYLQKGDRFTVLRQMADMRKSSKVVKSGKDVRLKTDPRILECNVSSKSSLETT